MEKGRTSDILLNLDSRSVHSSRTSFYDRSKVKLIWVGESEMVTPTPNSIISLLLVTISVKYVENSRSRVDSRVFCSAWVCYVGWVSLYRDK